MNIGLLVDAAIGILRGYGIKLAKNAGEAALQVANQIFDAIQNHFSANETARQTLDLYKADPETFESALRTILQRELEQSEAFALRLQELADALKEVAPAVWSHRSLLRAAGRQQLAIALLLVREGMLLDAICTF